MKAFASWSFMLALLLHLTVGCRTHSGSQVADEGGGSTVSLMQDLAIYFTPSDNQRERQFSVQLPSDTSSFQQATLNFNLACPNDRCDFWDRIGSLGIVEESGRYLELFRFMTPYGIGAKWSMDMTPFLPLLKGQMTFKISIDTWVGPGHAQGDGWLTSASLTYKQTPAQGPRPFEVVPLLSNARVVYGDPKQAIERALHVEHIPKFRSAQLLSLITGHGQGNAEDCAEFCPKDHTFTVGDQNFTKKIWRSDCATSVSAEQKGNFLASRAGWCPGDMVYPWIEDVTTALRGNAKSVVYSVENYTNTCRPDAASCSACRRGVSCAYDGGLHTEPVYYVTSYLILSN